MGSTFGHTFRITTFGESHGGGLGAVIDGCPAGLRLDLDAVQHALNRRRPGQSDLTTPRNEPDVIEVLSGLFEGRTIGSPLTMLVRNRNAKPEDYADLKAAYRPSHADYTTEMKYGIRNWQGGGRASARETVARVMGGAVAAQLMPQVQVVGWVDQVHTVRASVDPESVQTADVEASLVRCPDPEAAKAMVQVIRDAKKNGDTVGGTITCVVRGAPTGWGEPVFDKLEADLAKAMLSLPACKGFELGSGFSGTLMMGSEHNDVFEPHEDQVRTRTNHSGGVQGGITNGMPIVFRVAFKPVSTLMRSQSTVDQQGQAVTIHARGRHDPCVLPRAVVLVESMAQLVLADHMLRAKVARFGDL